MQKSLFSFFALFAIPFGAMAQFGPRLECFTLEAPEVILTEVKQIAVLDFEQPPGSMVANIFESTNNRLGKAMADQLITALMDSDRGLRNISTTFLGGVQQGKAYFKGARTNIYDILERNKIDQIMNEQKLVASGAIDDSKAIDLGKLLGVQAMIFGSITLTSNDQKSTYDSKDSKGNVVRMYRTQRTVSANVSMRVVSTQTGKILANTTEQESRTVSRVSDGNYPDVANPYAIIEPALPLIAYKMANLIAPYYQFNSFEILKIKEKEFKDAAKDARDFANIGQLEKAYPIYRSIVDKDPYNADAAYNLGIIYEAAGDYAKALQMYAIASNIVQTDKTFLRAKERCSRSADMIAKIEVLGIKIEPMPLDAGQTPSAVSKGSTVKTRGNRADRFDVFSEKSRTSQVVMKVPGGSEFEIIEQEGEWVKIKLLAEKQGYIHRENLNK